VAAILASVLHQRRWQVCTRPFPHIVARHVFAPDFYNQLDAAFGALLQRGLSESHDQSRLSRNIRNYDAYSTSFSHDMPAPLQIFISREWHDMLAQLAGVPATNDVAGGFHHHLRGSRSGQVHNDLNPGWFINAPLNGAVNLTQNDLCDYTTGHRRHAEVPAHQAVRAVAVLFYLHNAPWQEGDGGETGLYSDRDQPVGSPDKAIPPLNNTLLLFECRPNSYHSFIQNRVAARNSLIMWLHRPLGDAVQRWGEDSIIGWSRRADRAHS
jgi:hypothetical protein